MTESIKEYSKFYEYERKYCKNIENITNITENIFVGFGAGYLYFYFLRSDLNYSNSRKKEWQ